MWDLATTDEFHGWFAVLDEDAQVEVIAKVELLKLLGPQFGRSHADTLNDSNRSNMKELRADTRDQVMRIAFAFDPDRSAILLLVGNKSGVSQKRFYKQLIARADALYDEHLKKIAARKKGKGKQHGQVIRQTGQADDHGKDASARGCTHAGTPGRVAAP
jgi:hypothetical protein